MEEVTPIGSRKSDHIRINLEQDVQSGLTTGLEDYHFIHRALPEIDLAQVDPGVSLFGKQLSAPILISSMTGGTAEAERINHTLAQAAEHTHIAMGVGSQRIALENPSLARTFQVRRNAPTTLVFANLGAIQLNYGYGLDECQRAIDMIQADALILHLNALQEALQKEGQTSFAGLLDKIGVICRSLPVPVIAKEVGWGFSTQDVTRLVEAGVSAIDVSGAGGTSWSQVEMHRAESESRRQLAAAFQDWGIPTAQVILNVTSIAPKIKVIASGGLRSGVDIAKCIALGASLGGMAGPFLKTASRSVEAVVSFIELLTDEIKVCMFVTGSSSLDQLRQQKLVLS
jgi:isopentenyl-diphosphate delta-isomerase